MNHARLMKNKELFINKLNDKYNHTLELQSEYFGTRNNITLHCKVCNKIWIVKPRSAMDTGCPYCNNSKTRKKTNEEYIELLKKVHGNNIINIEPYCGMSTSILHHCNIHDIDFKSKPSYVYGRGHGCPQCSKKKIKINGEKKQLGIDLFRSDVFNSTNGEFCVPEDAKYIDSASKIKIQHNIPVEHCFMMTPNSFRRGERCPVCKGRQVVIGYNDIHTTNSELGKLLFDHEEGYLYTEFSGHKTNWRCNCGNIIYNKAIRDVNTNGLSCSICSDGISYPNKFIYNLLSQHMEIFDCLIREYTPDWCQFYMNNIQKIGRYDIYFEYKNKRYIIEMDGGLGHGNKSIDKTQQESLYIDQQKDLLAKKNGILVIRIDAYYNTKNKYQYIKENIMKSKLSKIINLDIFDFDLANNTSLHSYMLKAIELWNKNKSISEISNIICVSPSTIMNYLKLGTKSNLCNYSAKISRERGETTNSVICIETKNIYPSIVEASKNTGVGVSGISKCCRGIQISTKSKKGMLHWMYYSDYIKLNDITEYEFKESKNYTKVICENTGVVYDSIKEAAAFYEIRPAGIQAACSGRYSYSGIDKKTGEKLIWKYYSKDVA